MSANELAEDLEGAKLVILRLNATLLQQDYEIQDLAEWKRSLMEANSQQQAEIEALKKDLLKYDKLAWDDLTKAEIESGLSRVKWAELLIKQLPEEHEGRNSWLLNYGKEK